MFWGADGYIIKLNADGTIDTFKSRLVVKGNDQKGGIDYLETFSPVVRTTTITVVLGVATAKNWSITSAFLHRDLHEDIYMKQPVDFVDPAKPTHVCKLDKAIYGLKQAPQTWFDKFSTFLLEYGFSWIKVDPSMFLYHRQGKTMVLCCMLTI